MKVLLLVFPLDSSKNTTNDHINALSRYINGKVTIASVRRGEIPIGLKSFDAVILHHTTIIYPYRNYTVGFTEKSIESLRNYSGCKLAFAQDEYRSVYERRMFFNDIRLNHLFSLVDSSGYELMYGMQSKRTYTISTVLPGYLTDEMISLNESPLPDRPIEIGYRGRILPTWMGDEAALKSDIVKHINTQKATQKLKLKLDISSNEHDRLYGESWIKFLSSTRAQIVTSSGASILDIDGTYVEKFFGKPRIEIPKFQLERFSYHMMSPRILEYAASGNLIIRISGQNYSEILNDTNSLSLSPDASNLSEVVMSLREEKIFLELTKKAREIFIESGDFHYSKLGSIVNSILSSKLKNIQPQRDCLDVKLYNLLSRTTSSFILCKSSTLFRRIYIGTFFYFFKILSNLNY